MYIIFIFKRIKIFTRRSYLREQAYNGISYKCINPMLISIFSSLFLEKDSF